MMSIQLKSNFDPVQAEFNKKFKFILDEEDTQRIIGKALEMEPIYGEIQSKRKSKPMRISQSAGFLIKKIEALGSTFKQIEIKTYRFNKKRNRWEKAGTHWYRNYPIKKRLKLLLINWRTVFWLLLLFIYQYISIDDLTRLFVIAIFGGFVEFLIWHYKDLKKNENKADWEKYKRQEEMN